jgi:stalled ribosome rescue protein Dom34
MSTAKKLGIWMDHSNAHLMEFTEGPIQTKTLSSNFTHQDKENTLERSENQMHNKEQHLHAEYYKKLGDVIRNYEAVILFGPTQAKVELYNSLKANHLFSDIKMTVKQTDKLTENQQHAFVREYFSTHHS